jgi:transposase
LILILDNLSVHKTHDVLLWALAHPRISFLFQPTYSPWLNLIEPWWKTLRSLALRGNSFEQLADLTLALYQATDYWNLHRKPYLWRKAA